MFELVKPPVPATSPRLSIGPNSCGCTLTHSILTFSALAALSRIDTVSCTAVPGPPAIFLPSRSAGFLMPASLRVTTASGESSKLM